MTKTFFRCCILILALLVSAQVALAIPVDLELIIATDTSGSVDSADFTLRRTGIETTFRDATVISAIEDGAIGSIAVTLWDFADSVGVAVDWMQISNTAESNAFADAVAAASRGPSGGDGQSNMLTLAAAAITDNGYEGTRSIVDMISEGAPDIDGCSYDDVNCLAVQAARDAFLAAGGTAINALWMDDRDFFGLDPTDLINAFEYGALNVIGGTDAFQVFAATNEDFVAAFDDKLIREISPEPVPEPATMLLLGSGLIGFAGLRRKFKRR